MRRSPCLLASAFLALAACGGGGGGGGDDALPPITVTNARLYESEARVDGDVTSRGRARAAGVCGITGDLDAGSTSVGSMQFFSFLHDPLPAGATFISAELELYQEAVIGTPYTSHGVVVVDQMQLGPDLQGSDYWRIPVAGDVGVLSRSPALGWKRVDVTEAVRRSLAAGWNRTAFRTRWSGGNSNADGNFDLAMFNDGEDSCGSGNLARLVISFR